MRVVLALVAVLAACTSPDDAPDALPTDAPEPAAVAEAEASADGFDAQAWLAEARALPTDDVEGRTAHTAALADAVDWKRACDSYVDPTTGEVVYEPTPDDAAGFGRGDLDVTDVGPEEAVVAITCYFGAYQGAYALVHVDGPDVSLLSAPALDADGWPLDVAQSHFSTPALSGFAEGEVVTFAKGRGLGDCGTLIRYAAGGDDTLAVREVRQRACGDAVPDPLPPPDEWPVVYAAE